MTGRQFLWGLSSGIGVLAVAGAFWYGIGAGHILTARTPWWIWSISTSIQAGVLTGLLWTAFRLRRRSGFKPAEFRRQDERQRAENRGIRVWFAWTTGTQTVLVAFGVWWFVHAHAVERIWPWIGLVVSLHLIPLARVFHVRTYYVTGIVGSVLALVTFTSIAKPYSLAILGVGMAALMWVSAAYLARNADRVTARAIRETW